MLKRFVVKTAIYALVVVLLNIVLGHYLRLFETRDMGQEGIFFPKLRWEEYYDQQQAPDVVILGSSHAYRTYEPNTLEAGLENELNVFNLGSSAQAPVTSYYILEEVLQRQRPDLVIMDIYFMVFTSDELLHNGLINWNYMQEGSARRAFFREGFSFEEQIAIVLFPSNVYRKYLEPSIKKLLGRDYLPPEKGHYREKGFVGFSDTLSMEALRQYNQFSRFETQLSDFTKKNRQYLLRIAERCRELDIPLVFSVAPMPEISVQQINNYPEISAHFQALADSAGVPYLDFNRQRLPGLKDEVHYYDDDHLNLAGATYFSNALAPMLNPMLQNQ